ncbi:YbaN family protein [Aliiruegeria haliotis]|uniref:YbaN family protein n=1 Tax=Aliiruegeria haliotis TaxID=1280846 RepID=UPI000D062D5B|nr:YbaN family protein [Aliiruegeria haliotis]
MRILWGVGGATSLSLGAVGIVLPLLPTVPFLILAAFCFSRSSDQLHDWLVNHETLGPPIRDWQEYGAISRRGKLLATLSISAVFCLSLVLGVKDWVLVLQAIVLTAVLTFIWSRPEG